MILYSHEIALPQLHTISEGAFSNIGRLESFDLPESLRLVATTALSFYVDRLFCLTEEPPVWEVPGNAGYVIGPKPDGCTLFVPFGCSEAYKASEKWSQFKIEEMPEYVLWHTYQLVYELLLKEGQKNGSVIITERIIETDNTFEL